MIEIGEVLTGLPFEFLSLKDRPSIEPLADETGTTFAENALLKAKYYATASGLPTLAEDSGILIDALPGELGIKTRRWGAGETATDAEWIDYFLRRMESESNRQAQFVCTAAVIDPSGNEHLFTGICPGMITRDLDTNYLPGLPLTGCFIPNGYDRVFSKLTLDQKNRCSHRGRAMHQVRTFLESLC